MTIGITESVVEEAVIGWLQNLGYQSLFGPDIACDSPHPERESYSDVVLVERLRRALDSLNPTIPFEALEIEQKELFQAMGDPGLYKKDKSEIVTKKARLESVKKSWRQYTRGGKNSNNSKTRCKIELPILLNLFCKIAGVDGFQRNN